jgi:hypothetical protein
MYGVDRVVIPPGGEEKVLIVSITHQKLSQQSADIELMPAHLAGSQWNEIDPDAHALTALTALEPHPRQTMSPAVMSLGRAAADTSRSSASSPRENLFWRETRMPVLPESYPSSVVVGRPA